MKVTLGHRIAALMAVTFVTLVEGHGSGAPESRCESMGPGHWVASQSTPSPYKVTVDKTSVSAGSPVTLTLSLSSPDQPGFKGFFVMVKRPSDDANNYGHFDLSHSDLIRSQPVSCFGREASAMTHKDNIEKSLVRLVWMSPAQIASPSEDFEVKVTFVQNFWTIWDNLTAPQRITVTRESPGNNAQQVVSFINLTRSPVVEASDASDGPSTLIHKSFHLPRDAFNDVPTATQKNETSSNGRKPSAPEVDGAWGHFKNMWMSVLNYFGT